MEIYKYEFCTPCAMRFVSRLNKKVNARVLIVLHTGSDVKKVLAKHDDDWSCRFRQISAHFLRPDKQIKHGDMDLNKKNKERKKHLLTHLLTLDK